MKKRLLLFIVTLVLCIFRSCTPSKSKVFGVGDRQELLTNDGAVVGTIKLNSADCSVNEDGKTCSLALTFIFYPIETFRLENGGVFVLADNEKICTVEQKNLETNGFDIFKSDIAEETEYIFCYVVPKSPYFDNLENRADGYDGYGIGCYVNNAVFKIYTGKLFDKTRITD